MTKRVEECTTDLSVTTDGGSAWTRRRLPEALSKGAFYAGARLYVLDERTLVMDRDGGLLVASRGKLYRFGPGMPALTEALGAPPISS